MGKGHIRFINPGDTGMKHADFYFIGAKLVEIGDDCLHRALDIALYNDRHFLDLTFSTLGKHFFDGAARIVGSINETVLASAIFHHLTGAGLVFHNREVIPC